MNIRFRTAVLRPFSLGRVELVQRAERNMSLTELEGKIAAAGDKVRELKGAKASKDEITKAVGELLALKEQLPDGHKDKPVPKGKKGKSAAPAAAPAAPAAGGLDGLQAAVDAAAEKVT